MLFRQGNMLKFKTWIRLIDTDIFKQCHQLINKQIRAKWAAQMRTFLTDFDKIADLQATFNTHIHLHNGARSNTTVVLELPCDGFSSGGIHRWVFYLPGRRNAI